MITITLVPERKNGGFDATRGKDISFWIIPKAMGTSSTVTTGASSAISTMTSSPIPTTTSIGTVQTKKTFTKNLARNSSGTEVRALQEFLKKTPAIYPEGIVNGNFGPATERAVKRLQEKYGLAKAGVPGYGTVGPKTRALLNSLVGGKE